MQTSTHSPTRAASPRSKVPKPVYPELPNTEHPGFWLAALLRDQAEVEALDKLHNSMFRRRKAPDQITSYAVSGAVGYARAATRQSATHVKQDGLLPFAHAQTTYFAQEGGAA